MLAYKKCPFCGSEPLELVTKSGGVALSCHNNHNVENWDCPLCNVVMETWEWNRRADIKE